MPPSASAAQEITHNPDRDIGLLALGRSYEKKKQKLLLELQLDYKDYVSKEKLRTERQDNLFFQKQAPNRRLKGEATPVTSKSEPEESEAVNITSPDPALSFPNTSTRTTPCRKEGSESSRDAVTPTKVEENRARSPDSLWYGPQRRRRWKIHPPKNSSEDELITDEEEFDSRLQRRRDKSTNAQEYEKEQGTPQPRGRRALQNTREMQALDIQKHNNGDGIWKEAETPQHTKTTARFTPGSNKQEKEFAAGLIIGAVEERSVTLMKKEQYKRELLRQIEEQQKNKIKDQRAGMNIGATETTAPRKEHDSLKQDVFNTKGFDLKCENPFQSPEHRNLRQNPLNPTLNHLPENMPPLSGVGTVQPGPAFDYCSGFTGMQGQAAIPRVPVGPPVPHMVSDAGKVRMFAGAQLEYETSPTGLPPVGLIDGSLLDIEGLHADSSRRRSESTQSYREALRQQITEKEENTRKVKEKKRRDTAELEAELVVYDPWGKGGGGAPIKDKHGNLISDLYQMHRINNNRLTSLRDETGALISQQDSSHQSSVQQEGYKEQLRQQLEEKKRKQAEERERIRIAEEKEEKRLQMERARMQQQYEEEKRRENEIRTRACMLQQNENEQRRDTEIRQNKKKERNKAERHDTKETISSGEKNQTLPQRAFQNERGSSPPIPTLQRRHKNVDTSRLSPVVSPPKSRTDHIVSAPNNQPSVPAGQQEVIRELSSLRNLLRKQQRELELELEQRETRQSNLNKY